MSGVGSEGLVASQWIKDTLTSDVTLMDAAPGGFWDGPAYEATAYPILRAGAQSPGVVLRTGAGTAEVWSNMLWLVRGITDGSSYEPLDTIAQHIHADLHGVTGLAVPGGMIHACVREESFQQESINGGRQFRSLGGIYRIYVSGT